MIVYFSKNDLVNAAYKLRTGSIVQLKQKTDKNFDFAIKSSQKDFEKLNFVAFNFASKVMGLNPKVTNLKNFYTLSLSSKRESIAFVAFMYFENKEYFEEPFEIKSAAGLVSQGPKSKCRNMERYYTSCKPYSSTYESKLPLFKSPVIVKRRILGFDKSGRCGIKESINTIEDRKLMVNTLCYYNKNRLNQIASVYQNDWNSRTYSLFIKKELERGTCKKIKA